jgi:hypothetical protein
VAIFAYASYEILAFLQVPVGTNSRLAHHMFGTPESGCALLFMTRLTRVFAKGTVLKRSSLPKRQAVWIGLVAAGCLAGLKLSAADFTVTSPGFSYTINGVANTPALTLVRGRTYTFAISTACGSHPFKILAPTASVSNNDICSGTITFHVPTNAVNYSYECSIHLFGNTITTVPPPTPPPANIVGISVSNNLFLASTGTNGFGVFPEYSTNVLSTNWFALTVITNRLIGGTNSIGTNETICGRPPGDNIFIRIRTQ